MPDAEITSGHRFRSVDALRGIACVLVVTNHTLGIPGGGSPGEVADLIQLITDAGLAIFFVVSGYLISAPFIRALLENRPAPSLSGYALRRTMRIGPAYWVALLVTLLTVSSASHLMQVNGGGDMSLSPFDWFSGVFFFQTWVPGSKAFIALPVIWTLPVEIVFYAMLPLLYVVARRLRGPRPMSVTSLGLAMLGVYVLAVLLQWWYFAYPGSSYSVRLTVAIALFHVSFLSSMLPGMLLALALTPEGRVSWRRAHEILAQPRVRALWPTVCTAVFLVSFALWHFADRGTLPYGEWRRPLNAICAGIILWVALESRSVWWRRTVRVMAPIGTVSYGLFLWHWLVLRVLFDGGVYPITVGPTWLHLPIKVALCVVLSTGLGALSWYLVERPALRWSATRAKQLDARSAARQATGRVLREAV